MEIVEAYPWHKLHNQASANIVDKCVEDTLYGGCVFSPFKAIDIVVANFQIRVRFELVGLSNGNLAGAIAFINSSCLSMLEILFIDFCKFVLHCSVSRKHVVYLFAKGAEVIVKT